MKNHRPEQPDGLVPNAKLDAFLNGAQLLGFLSLLSIWIKMGTIGGMPSLTGVLVVAFILVAISAYFLYRHGKPLMGLAPIALGIGVLPGRAMTDSLGIVPVKWIAGIGLAALMVTAVLSQKRRDPRLLAGYCALILMSFLVGQFSGTKGGPDPMTAFLMRQFSMDISTAGEWVHYIRKTIHFVFYGSLGWIFAKLAFRRHTAQFSVLGACLWALSHAGFDEWRQSSAAGRTGAVADVALDMSGCAFFTFWFWMAARKLSAND